MEELRDIPGYEGAYAVTFDGRVWSRPRGQTVNGFKKRIPGGWKSARKDKAGYLVVGLHHGTPALVHRLVALAWLPNPLGLPEVNHLDGVKSNCHASNLEWCTRSDNARHAFRIGLRRNFELPWQCEVCGTTTRKNKKNRTRTCGSQQCTSEICRRNAQRRWDAACA